ncbi:MAG: acetolactate synthase small subunit [Bacteroidales bacterium]|nr:acetolactate synthase small subunit [Bacteroidales bacterium]MBN2699495.1 acetolactate synthase small subunit [Bacteroidales bacterium]
MNREFTITVFTEHKVGLLHRLTTIFTRRKISIESLNTSESEIRGIFRFTIVITTTEDTVKSVTKQIEKQIGILKAFYHTEDEIVYQEIALYKVPTAAFAYSDEVESLIRKHNARILTIEPEYIVVEKTGHKEETRQLFRELEPFGILQFARSGRIAITKQIKEITSYLREIEKHQEETADEVLTY